MIQDTVRSRNTVPSASRITVLVAVVASSVAGCAPPTSSVPEPVSEDDLPGLWDEFERNPGDRELQARVAASLFDAGRCDEATEVAQAAVSSPFDSWPVLVEGRCLEEAGRDLDALEIYRDYLDTYDLRAGPGPVRGRALLVERRLATIAAREALRNPPEATGPRRRVAVLPFRARGDDDLEPVGRTLSERLSADLAEIDGLEVVDPLLVRLVADGFGAPGALGFDSAQTAAIGRALGAGQVVQGTTYLDDEALNRLGARITTLGEGEREGGRVAGALEEIPRLEKELALETARALGAPPRPDERTRILYRGPGNLASLRAYGQGLDRQANEDYAEAVPHFAEAVRADPEFDEARRALEANVAVATLGRDGRTNVLAATPTVEAGVEAALRPGTEVDPLRLAIRAGTSDVSATQGERITGVVAASTEDGSVGSIQNLGAPARLTPGQLSGLIRILVVVPGG